MDASSWFFDQEGVVVGMNCGVVWAGTHERRLCMHIASTHRLFAWETLQDSPSLGTIKQLLASIPDAALLEGLRQHRNRGRKEYTDDEGKVHQQLAAARIRPVIEIRRLWKDDPERLLPITISSAPAALAPILCRPSTPSAVPQRKRLGERAIAVQTIRNGR